MLAAQDGPHCATPQRAMAWFTARGSRVTACSRTTAAATSAAPSVTRCAQLGLDHRRTRLYTPRTNGKAERFIQTLPREWAYARPYATSQARRQALRPWPR